MRVTIAAIGKQMPKPATALFDEFTKRLPWKMTLKEVEAKSSLPTPKRIQSEAVLLLAAVPKGATIIALDERGKAHSSQGLADQIAFWQQNGASQLAFLIGGADGHGEAVLDAAHHRLSLGVMTWPHMLVRVMLAEQLYRAHTILTGHPYHRA